MDSEVLYLPPEIIRKILERLPVKTLIRFQCVCKDWKNLMKNPSFIDDHLQQSSHQIPSLLFQRNYITRPCCLHLLDCGLEVRKVHSIPRLKGAKIVGSCNGLLCVEIDERIGSPPLLSLWNPATSAIRDLPRGIVDDRFSFCVTGFGFSSIVKDYKIIRIYYHYDHAVVRAEVFSLNRGSWKGVDIENLKVLAPDSISKHVTANGAIFWLVTMLEDEDDGGDHEAKLVVQSDFGEDEVKVVVSFDIAKEVFTLIPMPDLEDDRDVFLNVYDNKLAIPSHIWVKDSHEIDLWVFDEGTCASGATWRRIKRYASSILKDLKTIWSNTIVCKPFLYKEYIEHAEERRDVLYLMNLTTNEFKKCLIPYLGRSYRIYNHVESLVSVWP